MSAEGEQVSLFGQDGCAGKMFQELLVAGSPKGRISASSSRKSSELKAIPLMSLDLTPGHGNLLGESYWEMISPWLGGSSILNTGPAPLNAEDVYILSQILEVHPHRKYYLSKRACLGILRRSKERGKELPPQLKAALMLQAGLSPDSTWDDTGIPVWQDCLNPWDTQQSRIFTPAGRAPTLASADGGGGRNPAGLLFAAGFCAGAGPSAGGIGYREECSPTLKASDSGTNMVPTVLCLNDQGGSVMECTENVTGTLRAQEHGHQPLVLFENHGKDARYKGPLKIAPTVAATYGSGGNNVPLVSPAVFTRKRVDCFQDDSVASTESARQHKDATDLVYQAVDGPLLIRRLTPLECERLMGYPDNFTNIPDASDSARYRALGNSVSIPCVEYVMRGIAMAVGA